MRNHIFHFNRVFNPYKYIISWPSVYFELNIYVSIYQYFAKNEKNVAPCRCTTFQPLSKEHECLSS